MIYGMSSFLFLFALFTLRRVYRRWHHASSVSRLVASADAIDFDHTSRCLPSSDDGGALFPARDDSASV